MGAPLNESFNAKTPGRGAAKLLWFCVFASLRFCVGTLMSANKVTKITMIVDAAQGKAEVAGLNSELAGNVTAFQASATSATSANASIQQLLLTKNRLMIETSAVGASIKAENAELARLQGLAAASATGQKQFGSAIAESEQKLLALLVTQRELAVSTAENNAALKQSSSATLQKATADQAAAAAAAEHAAAQAALGVESDASAGKIIKVGVAVDKLSGVAIPGGKAIGTLAGAFSALSLGQLAVIAGGALLIGYMISLLRHKEEQIKIDQDQIALDVRRHDLLNTGNLFTREYANVLRDLNAVSVSMKGASQALALAQATENDAVRGSTSAYKEAAANTSEMGQKLLLYTMQLFSSVKTQQEATAERLEATKRMGEEITARIRLAAEMGQTAAALIAERRAAGDTQTAIELLTTALDNGALAQARFRAGQGIKGEIRQQVSQEAADAGLVLNHAEAERRYTEALKGRGEATVKLAEAAEIAAKNMKAFDHEEHAKKAHSHAGALRAVANELVNLKARAEDAESALAGDAFGKREERIATAMQREISHLEINKRDQVAAIEYVGRIQSAEIAKVAQDRTAAEQAVMVEIARMHIEAGDNEIQKHRQLLDLDVALRSLALRKEFGDTTQATDLITLYKRAKEEQFEKWYLDLWSKADAQRLADEKQMMDTLAEVRLKRDQETLHRAVKLYKDITAATSAVSGSRFQPANSAETAYILRLMSQLGPQFKEVAKDATLVKNAFSEVDRMFGFVGRDARTLSLQLRALTAYGKGDTFSGLRLSLKALGSEMISSGVLATNMAQSLFDAFSSSLTQGGNFVRALGANLVGGITAVVGQMLLQNGILLIADGIKNVLIANGLNALFPGAGAALLAAGHAEIIQGIIFGAAGGVVASGGAAIAGVIRGNGNQSSAAGAAAGAGAGAATGVSAATPTNASRQTGPTVINVAGASHSASVDSYHAWLERAFGDRRDLAVQRSNREAVMQREQMQQESGPVTIVVQLGESGAEKFLTKLMDGQGRLTLEGAIGKDKRRLRAALVGN